MAGKFNKTERHDALRGSAQAGRPFVAFDEFEMAIQIPPSFSGRQ